MCAVDRHMYERSFENLEQCLLHALAGDVAGHRRVVAALARDLVYLVDVDDTVSRTVHVAVSRLQQT